jgi:hypothetical protein
MPLQAQQALDRLAGGDGHRGLELQPRGLVFVTLGQGRSGQRQAYGKSDD